MRGGCSRARSRALPRSGALAPGVLQLAHRDRAHDLGVAYESTGRLDRRRRSTARQSHLDPKLSRARVNLGNIEAARGKWPKAERHYRRALRDSTTDYDAMNNLAVALLRQRRNLDEARALAERAASAGGERDSLYRATLAEVKAGAR